MEILERHGDIGPATALSPKERRILIDFARIGKNDVFYDLGSGSGKLVVDVVLNTEVKRAVGLEVDYKRFCSSVRYAKQKLRKQLHRVDFYCTNYNYFDFSDATVIYEGHERSSDEVEMLDDLLKGKKARILTIDLPLIRCRTTKPASYKDTQFFKIQTPLNKNKAKNKDQWASWVLQRPANISEVYAHYELLLKNRGFDKKERTKAIRQLRNVVNSYF